MKHAGVVVASGQENVGVAVCDIREAGHGSHVYAIPADIAEKIKEAGFNSVESLWYAYSRELRDKEGRELDQIAHNKRQRTIEPSLGNLGKALGLRMREVAELAGEGETATIYNGWVLPVASVAKLVVNYKDFEGSKK